MMHQRKSKKIIIYFFLFLSVGSINNIYLNNFKFDKIKNINVYGLNDTYSAILVNQIKNLNLKNIFFLNKAEIIKIVETNSLIKNYYIFRKYPYTLDVQVERAEFLAKINKEGKIFFVGSNGKLSKDSLSNTKLPYIFGNPEIEEFLELKKKINKSKLSFETITSFYFFQSKRWDLELNNNILIKLPGEYNENILDNAFEFLNSKDFMNIKTLDLRVKNQIIIND